MAKQIKQQEEKVLEDLQKQNQELNQQLKILSDMKNLEESSYYRYQKLLMMERQATATERMALALENSSEEEESEVPEIEPKK